MRCTTQRALVIRPSQPSFCTPGKPARNLSVTSLPRPCLRKMRAGDVEPLRAFELLAAGVEVLQLEARKLDVVDLAQVVVQPRDFEPLRFGCDHAPAGQVVQRGAPQHGLLAAGIHRDVAAYAAGLGRCRVDGEDEAGTLGGVGHTLGHHAGLAPDRGHGLLDTGQLQHLHLAHGLELFGVDDRAAPAQRYRATGIAGAAAARDDGQAQLDAALDQAGHLGLAVGGEHDERHLDAPVGRVGDMRDARQAVELDVVTRRVATEDAAGQLAQVPYRAEMCGETLDRVTRGGEQLTDQGVALGVVGRRAAFFDLAVDGGARPRSTGRGAWGCRADRLRGRGCAARPRCRPAPRTACAPNGRYVARRATGPAAPRRARRAAGARSRGRRTRCSCTESRAGAVQRHSSATAVPRCRGRGAFIGSRRRSQSARPRQHSSGDPTAVQQ